MPRGVLYTDLNCRIAIGVPVHFMVVYGIIGSIIHIGVGSCVARFGRMGNAKASDRGASNSMQGFTLFLCLYLKYITAVL